MQKFKIIGKPLLGKVCGRKEKRRKKKERKNNAKFSAHYVCQCTHNVFAHALCSVEFETNESNKNNSQLNFPTHIPPKTESFSTRSKTKNLKKMPENFLMKLMTKLFKQ